MIPEITKSFRSQAKVSIIGKVLCLQIALLSTSSTFAQDQKHIIYSQHFTRKLTSMHADFIQPVEGFYKINPKRRDDFLKYDLILQSEDIGFEMRFWLDRKYRQGAPQVSAFTLASSLATNNSHFDLHMNLFPEALAEDYFNADWAAYVDFIPKMHLTDHNYGRLLCLYRQDLGMMYNLMLFDQHDDEKDRRLYTLVFSDYPAQ